MNSKKPTTRSPNRAPRPASIRKPGTSFGQLASSAARLARGSADALLRRWPAAISRTRTGAGSASRAILALPPSTVRSLTAASLGLGAGLYLGRVPRIVAAIGIAPAILMGASMLGHRRGLRDVPVSAPDSGLDNELDRLDDDGSPVAAGTGTARRAARVGIAG